MIFLSPGIQKKRRQKWESPILLCIRLSGEMSSLTLSQIVAIKIDKFVGFVVFVNKVPSFFKIIIL